MLYISIRQDEQTNSTVEYVLCDDCLTIPTETEVEQHPAECGDECEICGATNDQPS